MSFFDLQASVKRAEKRLGKAPLTRKRRSDRGGFRIHPAARAMLNEMLATQERPRITSLLADLRDRCTGAGVPAPSRATVYHYLGHGFVRPVPVAPLPACVKTALYNLPDAASVPGHQLVFYCVNYGDLSAISFAAGRPWVDVYQALRMPGWRARSRGLLQAIATARGI